MNRPTTETDRLVLTPGQYTPSLAFRSSTSLESCTEIGNDDQGRLLIIRKWSFLSSGEERLWTVVQWLNGQAAYPDLDDLRAHLDASNYAAVELAVAG